MFLGKFFQFYNQILHTHTRCSLSSFVAGASVFYLSCCNSPAYITKCSKRQFGFQTFCKFYIKTAVRSLWWLQLHFNFLFFLSKFRIYVGKFTLSKTLFVLNELINLNITKYSILSSKASYDKVSVQSAAIFKQTSSIGITRRY